MNNKLFNFMISDDLLNRLKRVSMSTGLTVSAIIRIAILEYLNLHEK